MRIVFGNLAGRRAAARLRRLREPSCFLGPESLEARCLLAYSPFTGKDTSDKYMVPATKAADPPNPQWNMERTRAADTWWLYDGSKQSVVVVEDYGLDFRHEDFAASATTQGQFWDYGKVHSSLTNNFRFSRKGRDDFHYAVDITKEKMPVDWTETTRPDPAQYLGNIGAGIIGAKSDNKFGVAAINWDVQLYSAKVVVNDSTNHDIIAKRANRLVQYLRMGKVDGLQDNPAPQLIRAVSFGYSSVTDYGDIFHEFVPVPETAPDGAGHYDFVALGRGIEQLTGDAKQGILVTVPTGDWTKTWPTKYYIPGSWEKWVPWSTWDPKYPTAGGYGPGDPDNVIAVAATDINDRPWEGNAKNPIDIYAPGVNIWSLGEQGSTYVQESGTRQAQAHVAGAISLLYDVAGQHGFNPTYHQVREAIIEGGDDIGLGKPRLNIVGSIKYLSLLLGEDLTQRPDSLKSSITISGGEAMEGDSGATAATFTLKLSRPVPVPMSIDVRIEDGSAFSADRDYVQPSPTGVVRVTFPPQVVSQKFTVVVTGDRRVEADETVAARIIAAPSSVMAGVGSLATWTIKNDDVLPRVALSAARAMEGSALRPGTARVFATLSKASLEPVTVQYSVVNGTAQTGVDFTAPSSNVITFPANVTSLPIDIGLSGDSTPEPDKGFEVRIVSVVNADKLSLGQSSSVTIVDDDRVLVLLGAAVQTAAAGSRTMIFTVTLDRPVTLTEGVVSVSYRTADGTGSAAAVAGLDYQAVGGQLSFLPGEKSKTIAVTVLSRRPGQRYPKAFSMELFGVSPAGRLNGGLAVTTAAGRIS